ncbi:MAG TPA: caspase family protein [Rhizobacter sp.]
MRAASSPHLRQTALASAALLLSLLFGANAHGAGTSAPQAEPNDGLVHCLLPGQVRRLGLSTTVGPRRATRLSPSQCQAAGGEYVEPPTQAAASQSASPATASGSGGATAATLAALLPLASQGVPAAQASLAELLDQRGDRAEAQSWYEKAAAQGSARALIGLAGFLEKGAMLAAAQGLSSLDAYRRVGDLVQKATGGLVAGLSIQRAERLRVDLVSPVGAAPLPHVPGSAITLESAPGPLDVVVRVASANGVKSVRVNGQVHSPDAQGLLSIPLIVGPSPTTVLVQAEDEVGAQARAELKLVQRSAPLTAAAPVEAPAPASAVASALPVERPVLAPLQGGKRHAIVIANQRYQHWTALDTPRADAQAVASVLQQRFGFAVTLLQDVTRQQLLSALGSLRQQVGPQDQVLVYYAGHGQMDPVTARGYWIPVDGDLKDIAQWVSVIDVTDQLSAMSARHVLVIADSCYSGTLTRSLVPAVDQALTLEQRLAPLDQLARQRARVAMTSGGLEPVVDGGSINHSLFARSLLDVLGQVKAPVAAQELHHAVAARFAHLGRRMKVQQQPQYAPIGFAGHEAGDFVLAPL